MSSENEVFIDPKKDRQVNQLFVPNLQNLMDNGEVATVKLFQYMFDAICRGKSCASDVSTTA